MAFISRLVSTRMPMHPRLLIASTLPRYQRCGIAMLSHQQRHLVAPRLCASATIQPTRALHRRARYHAIVAPGILSSPSRHGGAHVRGLASSNNYDIDRLPVNELPLSDEQRSLPSFKKLTKMFYSLVHPDLFGAIPHAQEVNSHSMREFIVRCTMRRGRHRCCCCCYQTTLAHRSVVWHSCSPSNGPSGPTERPLRESSSERCRSTFDRSTDPAPRASL